jgi:hypothetical protein
MGDMYMKGRGKSGPQKRTKTHCKSGHPFTEENVYLTPEGHRKCKVCRRAIDSLRYERPERRTALRQQKREARARAKSKPDGEVPGFRD